VSYLHPIRLHFSGGFRADVSTVNNDPQHYDNKNFNPDFQRPGQGTDNGWWQPAGTGAWRLLDCQVTRACHADGSAASTPTEDSAVGLAVRETGDRSSAKIVDLDPQQQGVSMIFGLSVRLVDDQGQVLMRGDFEPVAFFDLNFRRSTAGGPAGASAYFQSVLKNVEWGDVSASSCLVQMKQVSAPGMLSIKFMTDRYALDGQQRGYGRVAGTIGPYLAGEPRTFVLGRHLAPQQGPYAPMDCRLDPDRRKILVDLGNSLPIDAASGDFLNRGALTLVAAAGATTTVLGSPDPTGQDNYRRTAGIYELPVDRALNDGELAAATNNPLRLLLRPQGAQAPTLIASESDDGIYVRPEQFVFRLDPGASESTDLIASKFGAPFPGARPQAQTRPLSLANRSPLPTITVEARTNADGRAKLTITAVDPGNPRGFIDGQVYAIAFSLQESATSPRMFDPSNFISLLMFSGMVAAPAPGWDDVHPIFEQYSHLYPRPHGPDPYAPFTGLPPSHPVVNLNDYDSVAGFARHIVWALELAIDHPSHMPVTRDLSGAKRTLLLRWLRAVGADGRPQRTRPRAMAAPAEAQAVTPAEKPAPQYAAEAFEISRDLIRHKAAGEV
jgi:hypothetical protein